MGKVKTASNEQGEAVEEIQSIPPKRIIHWITKDALMWWVTLIGAVIGIVAYQNSTIEKKISDAINSPEYVKKVSREIRPFIVFDINESVLYDGGGVEYLDDINFSSIPDFVGAENTTFTLTITPKVHLPVAPILEPLDNQKFEYNVMRGKRNDWVYVLMPFDILTTVDNTGTVNFFYNKKPLRFRLEILR